MRNPDKHPVTVNHCHFKCLASKEAKRHSIGRHKHIGETEERPQSSAKPNQRPDPPRVTNYGYQSSSLHHLSSTPPPRSDSTSTWDSRNRFSSVIAKVAFTPRPGKAILGRPNSNWRNRGKHRKPDSTLAPLRVTKLGSTLHNLS